MKSYSYLKYFPENGILKNSYIYNYIAQLTWLILSIFTLLNETNILSAKLYDQFSTEIWVIGLVSYLIGFIGPCRIVFYSKNTIFSPVFITMFGIFQFCIAITSIIFVKNKLSLDADNIIQIVTSIFAVIIASIGWFIHVYSQKNFQRRQHTVTVYNDSRMSDIFQEKIEKFNKNYSPFKPIKKKDVQIFIRNRKKKSMKQKKI